MSASSAGPEVFAGKNAWNPGCCQWVVPGSTTRSRSARTAAKSSGPSGGPGGSHERTSPGATSGTTAWSSIVAQ